MSRLPIPRAATSSQAVVELLRKFEQCCAYKEARAMRNGRKIVVIATFGCLALLPTPYIRAELNSRSRPGFEWISLARRDG